MKKRILISALIMLLCLVCFVSCAKENMAASDGGYMGGGDKGPANGTVGGSVMPELGVGDVIDPNRKIIKTVYESVQTERYDDFMKSLDQLIEDCEGYISSASQSGETYYNPNSYRSSNLTVRIPAERLDEFTSAVNELGVVYSYNEKMDDVTGAYVDVESRIAVLSAEETALLQMLAQATTVAETLEIRKSLSSVQADLASLRAQKQSYDSLIAYSTVNMNIYEVRKEEVKDPGFFEEVGDEFSDSMYDLGQDLRDFAVWFLGNIVQITIFAAVVTGLCILAVKLLKKRRARKLAKAEKKENNEEN